jgi:hypothetical protein
MSTIELTGKTKKGKDRIKQFGKWWVIAEIVPISSSQINKDWFIVPVLNKEGSRWINSTNDPDFEIRNI